MRIIGRHLVIAITAIVILLVAATDAAMGTTQIVNASPDTAIVNESTATTSPAASPGIWSWPTYVAGGIVIGIMAVGILFIFRERSGR